VTRRPRGAGGVALAGIILASGFAVGPIAWGLLALILPSAAVSVCLHQFLVGGHAGEVTGGRDCVTDESGGSTRGPAGPFRAR